MQPASLHKLSEVLPQAQGKRHYCTTVLAVQGLCMAAAALRSRSSATPLRWTLDCSVCVSFHQCTMQAALCVLTMLPQPRPLQLHACPMNTAVLHAASQQAPTTQLAMLLPGHSMPLSLTRPCHVRSATSAKLCVACDDFVACRPHLVQPKVSDAQCCHPESSVPDTGTGFDTQLFTGKPCVTYTQGNTDPGDANMVKVLSAAAALLWDFENDSGVHRPGTPQVGGFVSQAHPPLVVVQQCHHPHPHPVGLVAGETCCELSGDIHDTVACKFMQNAVPCLANAQCCRCASWLTTGFA